MASQNPPYGYGAALAQGPPPPVPPGQSPRTGSPPPQPYPGEEHYRSPPQQYSEHHQQYQPYPPPPPYYIQSPPGGYHEGPPRTQPVRPASVQSYCPLPPGPDPSTVTGGNVYPPDVQQYPPPLTSTPGVYSNFPPPQPSFAPAPSTSMAGGGNVSGHYPPPPSQDDHQYPPNISETAVETGWNNGYHAPQLPLEQGVYQYPPLSGVQIGQQLTASSTRFSCNPTPTSKPEVSSPPIVPPRQTDPFDQMASQFGNLNVYNGAQQYARGPTPARAGAHTPPPAPKPAATIRRTGPYNEIIEECPESSPLTFSLEWYRLPETPNFLICNYCHSKHIRDTSLAFFFERVKQPDGVPSSCRFWLPRVMDVLWPAAVRTGDLGSLKAYAAKRSQILDCQGVGGVSAEANVKWFSAKNGQLPGFVSCEACLEDRLIGTAFESQLEPCALAQRRGETWACDVCIDYISKAIKKFGSKGRNDWPACVAAIMRRMKMPLCRGQIVDENSCQWYTPRRHIQDFVACETCYLDKIALGEFDHEFIAYGTRKQSTLGILGAVLLTGEASLPQKYICDMAKLSTNIALDAARSRHDFSIWLKAANSIQNAPACTGNGIRGGTWYTLIGGCSSFDVCAGCYAGFVKPLGLDHLFQIGTRTSSDEVTCDFHPAQPRFATFMSRFVQSLFVGVFEPFESYVRKFAGISPCQGTTSLVNAVWYGFGDAMFCTDCYEAVVVGSYLDSVLQLRGVRDPRATMCCLYSPRMRQKWLEACKAGSANDFIAAAIKRSVVYHNTMAVVEVMDKLQLIKMQQALHQSMLSTQYQGMAGMREVADTTDGQRHMYGGSSYTSWEGAHAAQLMDSSREGVANAIRGDNILMKAQLIAQWKAVE